MKMKKLLLLVALSSTLTFPSFAYRDIYEPENDTAVSYSTYSIEKHQTEIVFVKYASMNGNDDYWIRLSQRFDGKILHYMYLNIDGKYYRLLAEDPSYKESSGGSSSISTSTTGLLGMFTGNLYPINRTPIRYFHLNSDLVSKISNAKKIFILYSTLSTVNVMCVLPDDFLQGIKKNFKYEFSDFPKLWRNKKIDEYIDKSDTQEKAVYGKYGIFGGKNLEIIN